MKMVLKIGENHKVIPRYHLPLVGRHFVFGLVTAPFRTIPGYGSGQRLGQYYPTNNYLYSFISEIVAAPYNLLASQ